MACEFPEEVSVTRLETLTLGDLVSRAETMDQDTVRDFLQTALETTGAFLSEHAIDIDSYPTIIYDEYHTGASYDPFHEQGEVLICGGPRGRSRGGEQVLVRQTDFAQRSLLTILSKALLHAYHAQLTDGQTTQATVEVSTSGVSRSVKLYDSYGLPAPAIEYGFTTLWDVYIEADITDRHLREAVIQEWADWYAAHTAIQTRVYEAVAFAVSDRITAAQGSPKEQMCHGFEIQEPLIRDGNVDLIAN